MCFIYGHHPVYPPTPSSPCSLTAVQFLSMKSTCSSSPSLLLNGLLPQQRGFHHHEDENLFFANIVDVFMCDNPIIRCFLFHFSPPFSFLNLLTSHLSVKKNHSYHITIFAEARLPIKCLENTFFLAGNLLTIFLWQPMINGFQKLPGFVPTTF